MNTSTKTALVLGATGGIGGELARQLQHAGWQVQALVRHRARVAARGDGIAWIEGDAMKATDVLQAAQGASVIVHAVNPPAYQRWGELVLPMMAHTIAAARATGARIVLPGTVYNYGPDAGARVAEDAPQHPLTRKGGIRVALERSLQAAAGDGVKSLILRAGDFFGPQGGNNWFAQGLVRVGKPVASVGQPGRAGVGHQWAYLPDVARTLVLLLEREATLPVFARLHFGGHWDATGTQMVEAVQRVVLAASGRTPPVRRMPWGLLMLLSPLVPVLREMKEMRYLWNEALQLRNDALVARLGHEPHTPLDEAVRTTLQGLGCLPGAALAAPTPDVHTPATPTPAACAR